ncbi:ferrous iron transport protein B [Candidatus Sumerlaeota bacterium]|nr:ferrous iron transport protein B [Candidatus Sumerlaeota bacterium]
MPTCHTDTAKHKSRTAPFVVALAGTPNSGKTTLFNRISNMRHKVGNYPGVTVEKRSATVSRANLTFEIVDLPGIYGLGAESLDELVTRDFCLRERPDLIVAVLDATNLERGLYLAIQWLELGFPLIIVLNMFDEAEAMGLRIDTDRLSQLLGAPVTTTVANKGIGVDRLLGLIAGLAPNRPKRDRRSSFGLTLDPPIEDEIARVAESLRGRDGLADGYPLDWLACRLLEGDAALSKEIGLATDNDPLAEQIRASRDRLIGLYGQPPALLISARRHEVAKELWREVVTVGQPRARTVSDRVDRILTSPHIGLPLFLLTTCLVFEFAFALGKAPMRWTEAGIETLSAGVVLLLPHGMFRSLVVEGIIGGVGGVIVFLPNILLLFMAMAVLEDSGYMARGAAVMERLMARVGLHGKSFIPLMVGFGCNVPAIMASRTLENWRDRLVTILVTPMMSCGARLPVYVLFISVFFTRWGGLVLFSIYLIGILMAAFSAMLFRRVLFRGPRTPFILEMPPYRWPTVSGVLIGAWDRAWMYLKKAGTVILALSVVVWFLSSYPRPPQSAQQTGAEQMRYSVAGRVGSLLAPVLRPAGLGDWKVGVALVSGFAAKEVVVSSFATLYNVRESGERSTLLREALRRDPLWNPVSAYALMIFVLLYVPCLPSMVILRRETGSWKWLAFQVAYSTSLAYLAAVVVFQCGRLLGLA